MKDLKIELKHPAGKKAVVMDKEKYYLIKNFILNYLKTNVKATHTEILESIKKDFKMNKTNFQGSIGWHLEWVKLNLEARKEIRRFKDNTAIKYSIFNKGTYNR